jgi:hypothetical protein
MRYSQMRDGFSRGLDDQGRAREVPGRLRAISSPPQRAATSAGRWQQLRNAAATRFIQSSPAQMPVAIVVVFEGIDVEHDKR